MPRSDVNTLSDGAAVDEVYLLSDKQLRVNRIGDQYLLVRETELHALIPQPRGVVFAAVDAMLSIRRMCLHMGVGSVNNAYFMHTLYTHMDGNAECCPVCDADTQGPRSMANARR